MGQKNRHILYAFDFDTNGGGKHLVGKAITDKLQNDELAWVHLDANHDETRPRVTRYVAFAVFRMLKWL